MHCFFSQLYYYLYTTHSSRKWHRQRERRRRSPSRRLSPARRRAASRPLSRIRSKASRRSSSLARRTARLVRGRRWGWEWGCRSPEDIGFGPLCPVHITRPHPTRSAQCTHAQKLTPIGILKDTLAQRGVKGLYAGVNAVVIGNALKAGVRFTTYDQFKGLLKDDEVGLWLIRLRWRSWASGWPGTSPRESSKKGRREGEKDGGDCTLRAAAFLSPPSAHQTPRTLLTHTGQAHRTPLDARRSRCRYDGGDHCRHAVGDDQVSLRLWLPEMGGA